jgi:signal transduction histidine kinase
MKSRRLFWKMFISFWIAQTAFFVYLGLKTHQLTRSSGPLWLISAEHTLPLVADSAVAKFESGGITALDQELKVRSDGQRIRMWLIDPAGNGVRGNPLPQAVAETARETKASPNPTVRTLEDATFVSLHVQGQRGTYTLVARYDTVPILRGEGLFRLFAISTVLASIACVLLAHYLSKPIWQLRLATRRIAEGDLDARVGENFGNRKDEIGDLVRDFDSMTEQVRELLENQKRLLSDVSHELRSPLARLRVALALARRREDESQRSFHARIETEIERLDEMIGRILTLSRLESGQQTLTTTELDLNNLIEHVVSDARFEAGTDNQTTRSSDHEIGTGHRIHFTADAYVHVEANEELLRSSIENVLRNALYYTDGKEPIQVRLSADHGQARISIRDNGPGVPPESLAHLFNAFYRVDDSRVSRTGGTGLGLAIAKRAILAHHGTITAANVHPHGLQVEIRLPATAVPKVAALV